MVEHIDALREAIRILRRRHTFQIDAMVVRHEPQHDIAKLLRCLMLLG